MLWREVKPRGHHIRTPGDNEDLSSLAKVQDHSWLKIVTGSLHWFGCRYVGMGYVEYDFNLIDLQPFISHYGPFKGSLDYANYANEQARIARFGYCAISVPPYLLPIWKIITINYTCSFKYRKVWWYIPSVVHCFIHRRIVQGVTSVLVEPVTLSSIVKPIRPAKVLLKGSLWIYDIETWLT